MHQQILENNLAALQRHNPLLCDHLRKIAPAADLIIDSPPDTPATGLYQGRRLASRVDPLAEAARLTDSIDLIEAPAVVILGFGLGHHVAALAQKMRKTGLVIVYEPDIPMLRAVLERIDCSAWIEQTNLVIVEDEADRAAIHERLASAASIIAQGTKILPHPPSRLRLGPRAAAFITAFTEVVAALRTTTLSTLVHAATTCRNLLLNLDRYAAGDGILPLQNAASDRPALCIAAGPGLARNIDLLSTPGLRDRCILIAAQTVLKPLLRRGIRPHFVTALDYHEMSRRFYEGLTEEDLRGITLVCEPKVNRAVVEAFPGSVRCLGNDFLDRVLGPLAREMGTLKAGATVAHLSFYLAQYLGCNPIILAGQDLAFSEGLYYGPGAAIHDLWAPELNAFNTIEMMEWSRVARMKRTLKKSRDINGRVLYCDEQMRTYLAQFEIDFRNAPQQVIDATESGIPKQHTRVASLREVFAELGLLDGSTPILPPLPDASAALDASRAEAALLRIEALRTRVLTIEAASRHATGILDSMLKDQRDARRMNAHFAKMDACKSTVDEHADVMPLINGLNQLGVFKRFKADRAIELSTDLDPLARQRLQIQRDQVNVRWLGDAASEMALFLGESAQILRGGRVNPRITEHAALHTASLGESADDAAQPRRVAAVIVVDPDRSSLNTPRRLDELFAGRTALGATLERLARVQRIESIILLTPPDFDPSDYVDPAAIDKPLLLRPLDLDALRAERAPVVAARRFADTSWRGGLGGMTVYDEIIAPKQTREVMDELALDAVLAVGADWVLLDPSEETGCDAVIARHLERPDDYHLTFTQAPPGLVGCVISRRQMDKLCTNARFGTIGAVLSYMPHLPQLDPVGKDLCVTLPHHVRNWCGRLTFDTAARRDSLRRRFESLENLDELTAPDLITLAGDYTESSFPHHLELDVADVTAETAKTLISELAQRDDALLTLIAPADRPDLAGIIRAAADAGITAIHLRTDLRCMPQQAVALLDLPLTVLSIDLGADSAETARSLTGTDDFSTAIAALQALLNARAARAGDIGALALPWIAPRMARRAETVGEIESFVDRWTYYAGAAILDPDPDAQLIPLPVPDSAARLALARTMRLAAADLAENPSPLTRRNLANAEPIPNNADEQSFMALTARKTRPQPRIGAA